MPWTSAAGGSPAASIHVPRPTRLFRPHGYLVVGRNAARLRANYAGLNPTNCLGDFSGRLSRRGERLALAMPDYETVTNGTQMITNYDIRRGS